MSKIRSPLSFHHRTLVRTAANGSKRLRHFSWYCLYFSRIPYTYILNNYTGILAILRQSFLTCMSCNCWFAETRNRFSSSFFSSLSFSASQSLALSRYFLVIFVFQGKHTNAMWCDAMWCEEKTEQKLHRIEYTSTKKGCKG